MNMKTTPSKKSPFLPLILFITLLVTPAGVHAMGTHHPKTRPDALILLVEKQYRVGQGGNYTIRLHVKTLINSYQGRKSWADFRASYNKDFENIRVIEAKTIMPDGKVIPVTQREIHDITDPSTQKASIFSASRLKVVNFPSVEKGCTVELVMEKKSRLGLWSEEPFSLNNPVKLKRVSVSLPRGMSLSIHLQSRAIRQTKEKKGKRTVFTWVARNRPKLIPDPLMPPVENRDDTLIISTLHSWKDVSNVLIGLLTRRIEGPGRNLADRATASGTRTADEIFLDLKKKLEVFPIGLFKSRLLFSPPALTLRLGYGSQMDALLLFRQLLAYRGIKSELIAANSAGISMEGLRDCFDPALFNTFLIKAQGKFYSFDMKEAAPGITGLDGQMGLNLEKSTFEVIKDVSSEKTVQAFNMVLTSPVSFEADYHGDFLGLKAVSMKKMFKDLTPKEFKVRQSIFFHSLHPLAHPLSALKVNGVGPASTRVDVRARYGVKDFGLENSGLFFIPIQAPGLLSALFKLPPERKNDIFLRKPVTETVRIKIEIPEGFAFEGAPPASSGSIGPFSWENSCEVAGRVLACSRTVKTKRGFLKNGTAFRRLRQVIQKLLDPRVNTLTFRDVHF